MKTFQKFSPKQSNSGFWFYCKSCGYKFPIPSYNEPLCSHCLNLALYDNDSCQDSAETLVNLPDTSD